ncbi:hypothetical protein OIU76_003226, partial [Salix suchowensis]
MPSMERMVLDG